MFGRFGDWFDDWLFGGIMGGDVGEFHAAVNSCHRTCPPDGHVDTAGRDIIRIDMRAKFFLDFFGFPGISILVQGTGTK